MFLQIDDKRHVLDVSCQCVARAAKMCKHICALILYINEERGLSKTSLEQTWGMPSLSQLGKTIYSKGMKNETQFSKVHANIVPVYKLQPSDFVDSFNCALHEVIKENKTIDEQCLRILMEYNDEEYAKQIDDKCIEGCIVTFMEWIKESPVYGEQAE